MGMMRVTAGTPPVSSHDLGWAQMVLSRSVGAFASQDHVDRVEAVNAWLSAGPPDRLMDRVLVALDEATEHRGEDRFELPADVAARLARTATVIADREAARNPMLGSGSDVRATYAMTLGITLCMALMHSVLTNPQPE